MVNEATFSPDSIPKKEKFVQVLETAAEAALLIDNNSFARDYNENVSEFEKARIISSK